MRRALALLLMICLVLLCACGNSVNQDKTEMDTSESYETIADNGSKGDVVEEELSILGKWQFGFSYHYFLDNGVYYSVVFESSAEGPIYNTPVLQSYSIDDGILAISYEGIEDRCEYSLSENELILHGLGSDGSSTATLKRCDVEQMQYDITGSWKLAGTDGDFESFNWDVVNDYIRIFSFYSDGTYKADWGFTHRGEEYIDDPTYGRYELVNDGRVICFNNIEYYDYELLGYGLLKIVEPSGNVLLYILQ